MKDIGPAKRIVGMEIHRNESSSKLRLTQTRYVEKSLARFNMSNAKVVKTPLATHFKLSATLCPTDATAKRLMSSIIYESAVGSIMYLMIRIWSYIAYAIGKMSRFMSNLEREHWKAAKWIMRYISRILLIVDYFMMHDQTMQVRSWGMLMLTMEEIWISGDQQLGMFSLFHRCNDWRSTLQKCIS